MCRGSQLVPLKPYFHNKPCQGSTDPINYFPKIRKLSGAVVLIENEMALEWTGRSSQFSHQTWERFFQRTNPPQINCWAINPHPIRWKKLHTSWSQHWVHAYSILLVTPGRARYQVNWCLGIVVVMSRDCVIEDWPEAFIRVLMRLNNDVYTVLKEQRFEAAEEENRKRSQVVFNDFHP